LPDLRSVLDGARCELLAACEQQSLRCLASSPSLSPLLRRRHEIALLKPLHALVSAHYTFFKKGIDMMGPLHSEIKLLDQHLQSCHAKLALEETVFSQRRDVALRPPRRP
jgi:hypothetical protein